VLLGASEPRRVLVLRGGWACRSRLRPDGRRAILTVYLPGDLIGLGALFGQEPASDCVVALTSVAYRALDRAQLLDLLDEPEVALHLWHEREREARRLETWALGLAYGSAEERLASFLVNLYHRLRRRQLISGRSFRLPLTQQEIGNHLGLTVVHVNRVLRSLREQGLVHVHGGTAVINDLDRLVQAAGSLRVSAERRASADADTVSAAP
jgi:CRP-like cAMP-binding protein